MKLIYSVFLNFFIPTFINGQDLSIDFSQRDTVSNMVGFLHSMDENTPDSSLIVPLKPAYWRTLNVKAAQSKESKGLTATKNILLVSDIYGYPTAKKWKASRNPITDTAEYRGFIDELVKQTKSSSFVYDIWNEPDLDDFWAGTNPEFFNTFKMAHDQLRRNLGYTVEISGPSINRGADTSYLRSFCNYCLANKIQLDILSFHWLYINNDHIPVEKLEEVLLWCRKTFIEDAKYSPLKIKKIIVNEIVNEPLQHNPGFILAHFNYLEKGRADGACKACWDDDYSRPYSNCWVSTLDGLINRDNNKRSSWWATKTYADLSSVRYRVSSSASHIYAIAGNTSKSTDVMRVIVGYNDQNISTNDVAVKVNLNNLNKLPNFPADDRVRITFYKIENSGTNLFEKPIPLKIYRMQNGAALSLPAITLNPGEVIYADIVATSKITYPDEESELFPLAIFPNPSTSEIFVTNIDENAKFYIEIYNNDGQRILTASNQTKINISKLSKGVYYLWLTQKGERKMQKFIKV